MITLAQDNTKSCLPHELVREATNIRAYPASRITCDYHTSDRPSRRHSYSGHPGDSYSQEIYEPTWFTVVLPASPSTFSSSFSFPSRWLWLPMALKASFPLISRTMVRLYLRRTRASRGNGEISEELRSAPLRSLVNHTTMPLLDEASH